jgi:DNA-binding protein H-NS
MKGKCKHGYYTDPNGYHIFPAREKSTVELIEEASKLFKTTVEPKTEQETKQAKRDKELEQRTKEIRERFEKKGKLSDNVFHVLDNY